MGSRKRLKGFTLSELLIALAILGVIATFTIPKVLQSQQDAKYKSIAKEAMATFSAAYDAYRLKNTPTASTKAMDLLPYMNYVKKVTSGQVDETYGTAGTVDCAVFNCFLLHNGAMMDMDISAFDGTGTTNAIYVAIDPDARVTDAGGPANGNGKKILFVLYYNGRMTTLQHCLAGTHSQFWDPTCGDPDPPWFSWN